MDEATRAKYRAQNAQQRASVKGRSLRLYHAAKLRKAVTITPAWIAKRIERGTCEVTGIPFDLSPPVRGQRNYFAPSVDRIDPAGDYTPENTQVVIWAYNGAKGELSDTDARRLILRMAAGLARPEKPSDAISANPATTVLPHPRVPLSGPEVSI